MLKMASQNMQPGSHGPSAGEESFRHAVARNVTIASVVGLLFAWQRRDLALLAPVAALALWFSLGGHYVELVFLKGLRPRLPQHRPAQALARLLVWFGGGALLYGGIAITARALPIGALAPRPWWFGGALFIGLELVVHALLALRGRPNFYNGRG
jgi:hypothetical protein